MSQTTPTRKMGCARLYTLIAILTFNTMLMLIFGLVILHVALPPYQPTSSIGPSGINGVYSPYFRLNSYQFVSQEEAIAVGQEYDQWAQDGHWQVHPYTGLISREFEGTYLNIDMDGVRQTALPDETYIDKPALRIWMFGGSTMFGWGLSDEWTIPSILQRRLQARLPDYQVQVTNFGAPIYNSSQELALLIANLRLQHAPHAIVFMDGLNDVWYAMYGETQTALVTTLSAAWEAQVNDLAQSDEQPWITFNRTFPLQRLPQSTGGEGDVVQDEFWVTRAKVSLADAYFGQESERLAKIITTYRFNRRMILDIAENNGMLPLFLLQPWEDDYYTSFLGAVENQANTVNITNIFEDINAEETPLYLDSFHYSDFGSRIIAEAIADELIRRDLASYVDSE